MIIEFAYTGEDKILLGKLPDNCFIRVSSGEDCSIINTELGEVEFKPTLPMFKTVLLEVISNEDKS